MRYKGVTNKEQTYKKCKKMQNKRQRLVFFNLRLLLSLAAHAERELPQATSNCILAIREADAV